jgi:hypothetical protein
MPEVPQSIAARGDVGGRPGPALFQATCRSFPLLARAVVFCRQPLSRRSGTAVARVALWATLTACCAAVRAAAPGVADAIALPASLLPFPEAPESEAAPVPAPREESRDGFRLAPYGALWGDLIYATSRTQTGPFTLFVFSEQDQGEETFQLDVRRTRLGFDLFGPAIDVGGGASTGGRVEIDFHGDFITENRAAVLLRHA